ncbi:MAG TPA: HYR domain-containing protein [Bacteroidales bacterium]|nr:HYR domain-containing protein [Bacteroidales bacterium]
MLIPEKYYLPAIPAQPVITCPGNLTTVTDPGFCTANVTAGLSAIYNDPDGDITTLTWTITGATTGSSPLTGINNLTSYVFHAGINTVTYTLTDDGGLSDSCSFTVTVNDNQPPVITCPLNIRATYDEGNCDAMVNIGTPVAVDSCGIASVVGTRSDGLLLSDAYPAGLTTITWVATDVNGLTATCTQSVYVTEATLLTRYNFVGAAAYPASPTQTAGGITCEATSSEPFNILGTTGTAAGSLAFVSDSAANPAIFMDPSTGTNTRYFQFHVGGDSLYKYRRFKLYVQARRGNRAAQAINFSYSTDPTSYTINGSMSLLLSNTWYEKVLDWSSVSLINNPSNLYIRLFASNGTGGAGDGRLFIDNFQLTGVDGPLARPNSATIPENTSVTLPILNNDYFPCHGPATVNPVSFVELPSLGTAILNADNTVTYTPNPNVNGDDNFVYQICDSYGSCDTAIVRIHINAVNYAPAITCPGPVVNSGSDVGICGAIINNIAATYNDPDNNIISLTWIMAGATVDTSSSTGINNILNPYLFNYGATAVTYTVTDADGLSATCSFTVNIEDSEYPSIICPSDTIITIPSCETFAGGVILTEPIVDDNCDTLSLINDAPVQFPLGDTPVIWTVTDIHGLSSQCAQIVSVVQDLPMILNMAGTPVTCYGRNDGTATVTVTNGAAPYTYSWNTVPPQNTATAINLTAGNYTVTVYDTNGCYAIDSITITQPASALIASITDISNVLCYGDETGSVTAVASGGTPPYRFSIDNIIFQAGNTFSGLAAGSYTLYITDNNGCDTALPFLITQPALPLTVALTGQTNNLCFGQASGSATVLAGGGTPPYTYVWNTVPPQYTATASGLSSGTYTVSVDDDNNCGPETQTVTITEPSPLIADVVFTPILCPGGTATVTINAAGGTAPYTYTFNGITQVGNGVFTGIPASAGYLWNVFDTNHCDTISGLLSVMEPDTLEAFVPTPPVSCSGSTATVTIMASGGTLPYTYTFNGVIQVGNNVFTGIPAGTGYIWSVTDANACSTVTDTLDIIESDILSATAIITAPISCAGETATVTISVSGGTPPYTYTFNGITQSGDSVFTGIPAGTGYLWSVTDANGCDAPASPLDITEPLPVTATASVTAPVICNGGTATVTIHVSGGTPPYTYTFDGATQTADSVFTGIPAGIGYTWSVTDANGCGPVAGTPLDVTEPPVPTAFAAVTSPILCYGGTATISIFPINGVPPYTCTFNGVTQVGNYIFNGIPAGPGYVWSVTDANGCPAAPQPPLPVTEPPQITVTASVTVPPTCSGGTATVTIVANGGTPPYTYTFNGVTQTGNGVFTGIPAGTGYIASVTDDNDCGPVNDTIDVTSPDAPVASASVTSPILCNGETATVTISVSGGTPPYTYTFNGITQSGDSVFTGIPAGTGYLWSVTDANGCDAPASPLDITEPLPVTATASVTAPVICNGGTATVTIHVSGGTPPYTYTFDGATQTADSVFTGIPAGIGYTWSVTDANGCGPVAGTPLDVTEPPVPTAFAAVTSPILCYGGTATISIFPINGVPPYTCTFNGVTQVGNYIFNGIPAGPGYVWSVTDANGCPAAPQPPLPVTEPPLLIALITSQGNSCTGSSSGYATVTPTGGTPDYTYLWNSTPTQTTQTAIDLPSGTYTVIVTDANGCSDTASVTILDIEPITAFAGPDQNLCNADVTFLIGNTPDPGIGSWSLLSGPNTPSVFPSTGSVAVVSGLIASPTPYYFIYSIDNNGCVSTDTMMVINFNPPTPAYAGNDQEFCDATGNVTTLLAGNVPVFGTGTWTQLSGPNTATIADPSDPNTAVSGLTFGIYAFEWTIVNGNCQVSADVMNAFINAPATAYAGLDDTICEGSMVLLSGASASDYSSLLWTSSGTGIFSDPTIINPEYTPSETDILNGSVALTLHAIANEPCPEASDQIIITINQSALVDAGPDAPVCQNSAFTVTGATAQNCIAYNWITTGAGTLTGSSTLTPTYTPSAGESGVILLILSGTAAYPCENSADTMQLQINLPGTVYAGNDIPVCEGSTAILTSSFASNYSSLLWTTSGTGTFNDPTLLHPVYSPSETDIINGSAILTLHLAAIAPCPDNSDQMVLTITKSPVADAGPDDNACQDWPFTVTGATAENCAAYNWTTTGTGTLTGETTLTPVYTPASGETGIILLILNGIAYYPCNNVSDTMTLQINSTALVSAGPDTAVCQGEQFHIIGSTAANYSSLTWSTSGTGTFDNPNILDPVYTPSPTDIYNGYVFLSLTAGGNAPCPDRSDVMKLTLNKSATASAGPDETICEGNSFTVTEASAQMAGSLFWTTSGAGTLIDFTTLTPTYTPAAGETGDIFLILTATGLECGSVSDTMILAVNSKASAYAGPDLTTCNVTPVPVIDALAQNYISLHWSSNGSGSFSDPSLLNPVYTPSVADANLGMVVLTLNVTGNTGCADSSDQAILTLVEMPVAGAGPDATVCQDESFTVSGAIAASYSSVLWSVSPPSAGILINADSMTPTFVPASGFSGIATLILNVQGNLACGSVIISDEMFITVNSAPVVNAGPDQTIQPGASTVLAGSATGGSGFYGWNWQPDQMVMNPNVPNPVTLPLYSDTTFTLSVLDLLTGCMASDQTDVFISASGGGIKAVADYDTTLVNTPTTVAVLTNDINPGGVPLTISFCSFPSHGIVIINSDNTITYSPYPDFEGDDSFCYEICADDQSGICSDTLVFIHVKQPDINDLFIFNGLSPNSDGINDKWKIRGIENYPENSVTIYNRWGDVIRKIGDYNNTTRSWDGRNENGELMPNGTYFYILEIENSGTRKGWILMRGEE